MKHLKEIAKYGNVDAVIQYLEQEGYFVIQGEGVRYILPKSPMILVSKIAEK